MISKEQIDSAWDRAQEVEGRDKGIWRMDPCGALIKRDEYGSRRSEYGWEIDHVVSKAYLLSAGASEEEIDIDENLRAMHWANNDSKGINYPEYLAVRREKDGKNIIHEEYFTVNHSLQSVLRSKFSKYGI